MLNRYLGALLFVFWGCGALACVDTASDPLAHSSYPIVGGTPASPDEFPATVALLSSGQVFCTGTLVAPRLVVTAAHCVKYKNANSVKVVYGYATPGDAPDSDRLQVSVLLAHPKFDVTLDGDEDGLAEQNDIGIVVLKEPIPNAIPAPIVLASQIDSELTQDRQIHIVGYGKTDVFVASSAGTLFKATTPYIRHIISEMLAGKPGNPDTCNGDSGGSAYIKVPDGTYKLIGITSRMWAGSKKPCGDGGIYTLAGRYIEWLDSVAPPDSDGGTDSGSGGADGEAGGAGNGGASGSGGNGIDGDSGSLLDGGQAGFVSSAIDAATDSGRANPSADDFDASGGCSFPVAGPSPSTPWHPILGFVGLVSLRARRKNKQKFA